MDESEKFQILYNSLIDGSKEYVDFTAKVIGILLIIIAWLVATEDPFPILSQVSLMWAALISIVVGAGGVFWVSVFHYKRSIKRCALLTNLDYGEIPLFEHYKITIPMIGPAIFIHMGFFITIFSLIYYRYGVVV